ncbi:MAG: FGGY family carbohydrate kinase [Cytophagales bacterium]|nr:FGGY family carbohydrate kinase [Cytophagales bacterium]
MKYIIGIDIGTTSVKGIIIDEFGNILNQVIKEYIVESKGDVCELDSEVYWSAVCYCINALIVNNINSAQVAAISFSSQGETLICVDKEGVPTRKAIIWLDNRSVNESEIIKKQFDSHALYHTTGLPEVIPTWTATKILWLKVHEPHVFANTAKYLMVSDYIIYKLTGIYVTEPSVVSSTLYFDIRNMTWWQDMLSFVGINDEKLPMLYKSGQIVGNIMPSLENTTKLTVNTLVVTGAYDHAAGAVGCGNVAEGIATETTGASMAMVVTMDNPLTQAALNLPCQCHAITGKYFLQPYGQTAGYALKWFRDEFCKELDIKENEDVYKVMTQWASEVPSGCDGLLILPHLAGAGSPEFDTQACGVFYGIKADMGRAYFIRAIMEAVAYMIKKNIDVLSQRNIIIKEIRALGGGAKSELWNQIKSDVVNIPYTTMNVTESPAYGVALMAGIAVDIFPNLEYCLQNLVKSKTTYIPQSENNNYKKHYNKYCELYNKLKHF